MSCSFVTQDVRQRNCEFMEPLGEAWKTAQAQINKAAEAEKIAELQIDKFAKEAKVFMTFCP